MEEAYLTIGPVSFRLLADLPIRFHETCGNFSHVDKSLLQPDVVDCTIKLTDKPTTLEGRLIRQTATRAIFEHDGLEQRVNLFNGIPVGIYKEVDEHHVKVELPNGGQQEITISSFFLELLALERHLLRLNALVLHSSFIEYEGKSILFSAPSGTGKSTQAGLWQKYENVEIINGDRSIIHLEGDRFYSEGLPFCGSSQIHLNRKMPLGAIVFIEQWPDNIAEPMKPANAASKLYGEMSVNNWNTQAVLKSFDLIEKITNAVPMVHLKCNMEQDAVETLKHYLHEKGGY